ncbi:MAG: hypothetical protein IPJ88_03085 [Myxococcales bacterium]|nr:MAG: hypothetical protein IPJ88_03085 [Myxococcales bacterium]
MDLHYTPQISFVRRSVATLLLCLLAFVGPGFMACSANPSGEELGASDGAAVSDFLAALRGVDSESFKDALILEMMYSGMKLRNPQGIASKALIRQASEQLFNTDDSMASEHQPIERLARNVALLFTTPFPSIEACVAEHVQSVASLTLDDACDEALQDEMLVPILSDPSSVIEPVIENASQGIIAFIGRETGASGIASLLRTALSEHIFPENSTGLAIHADANNPVVLSHIFSELFSVSKAHAQGVGVLETIGVLLLVALVAIGMVLAAQNYLVSRGILSSTLISAPSFSFNFARVFSSDQKTIETAAAAQTYLYQGSTLAFEDSEDFLSWAYTESQALQQSGTSLSELEALTTSFYQSLGDGLAILSSSRVVNIDLGLPNVHTPEDLEQWLRGQLEGGLANPEELAKILEEIIRKLHEAIAGIQQRLRECVEDGSGEECDTVSEEYYAALALLNVIGAILFDFALENRDNETKCMLGQAFCSVLSPALEDLGLILRDFADEISLGGEAITLFDEWMTRITYGDANLGINGAKHYETNQYFLRHYTASVATTPNYLATIFCDWKDKFCE